MNLVDLPIFLLTRTAPDDLRELVFETEEYDSKLKKRVPRKVIVTGSSKYGFPTAWAEKVLLALLHHTSAYNGFADPQVYFSRGELLRTLKWPGNDESYQRLSRCMDQLASVRLKCFNSWRDNRTKEYQRVTKSFGIVASYEFRDSRKRGELHYSEYLSEFRWDTKLFESFDAGYLKKLNLDIAMSLKPLALRLYRLLDKRFYKNKTKLSFCMKTLAYQRLGMSRKHDAAQVRRGLMSAIDSLVKVGFLKPMSPTEQFAKKDGRWDVHFQWVDSNYMTRFNRSCQTARQGRAIRPELRPARATSIQGKSKSGLSPIDEITRERLKKLYNE